MAGVEFGLALDFGSRVGPASVQLSRHTELAKRAEQAGFRAVAASEVYGPGFSLPNALMVLAALAQQTTLRLVTGILVLPAWDPWKLALDTAQLDQMSGGRLTLGVGLGSPAVQQQGGWAMDAIGPTADETLSALRALWGGQSGFSGQQMAVQCGIPVLPEQPGGPRIWVADSVLRSVRRAANFDGWYAGISGRLPQIAQRAQDYRAALSASGKDPNGGAVAVNRLALATDSAANARELAERYFGAAMRGYSGGESADEAAADIWLVGTADQILKQVERYRQAGVTHILARVSLEDMPLEVASRTLEMFGRYVLPAFST